MTREDIIQRFQNLNLWQSEGQRAVHKPLLVLYAIGKLLRGENRLISYTDDIEENLKNLLRKFGPSRDRYNPQFPFWRLQNDGIWEVTDAYRIRQTTSGDAYITDLRNYNAFGGFNETIANQLRQDMSLVFEIIGQLLTSHFTISYYEDILQAVGIELSFGIPSQPRSPNFERNVLKAYEYKCAVCDFDVRLGDTLIALNACHIKWQQAGGPDEAANALALCAMHHKLFERGLFTLSRQRQILVSDDAHGSAGFQEWLMQFHRQRINLPQRQTYYPERDFIEWHVREVFQGDYRE